MRKRCFCVFLIMLIFSTGASAACSAASIWTASSSRLQRRRLSDWFLTTVSATTVRSLTLIKQSLPLCCWLVCHAQAIRRFILKLKICDVFPTSNMVMNESRTCGSCAQKNSPLECSFTPAPTVNCSRKSCGLVVRHVSQFSTLCLRVQKQLRFSLFCLCRNKNTYDCSIHCMIGGTWTTWILPGVIKVQLSNSLLTHDEVLCRGSLSSILLAF